MNIATFNKIKLPDQSGVYFFLNKEGEILYIGKATSLHDRVRSYFSSDLMNTRGPLIVSMVEEAEKIKFEVTDSVLEALILEAHYIKKYQPKYNSREKDNKSFNYVVVTKEDYPRVLVVRGRDLFSEKLGYEVAESFGPFTSGSSLKEALNIVRKIFPFRDKCLPSSNGKPCFNRQIGLCPGVCSGEIDKKDYKKIIKNISLFFSGKKLKIIKNLEKEMGSLAKKEEFEKASEIKKTIFALQHIQDVALLKKDIENNFSTNGEVLRIEAFDIAHMAGKDVVGVMTVLENGEINKSEYKKFKIRGDFGTGKNDDVGNLKEIVTRRLAHREWGVPNIVVVDGGENQFHAVKDIFSKSDFKDTKIVSVKKDEKHKPVEILGDSISLDLRDAVFLANNEAHRFAIGYYRGVHRNSLQ